MFGNLEIFQLAQSRAIHASARQSKIAANIANADTPGYRALDVAPFASSYKPSSSNDVQLGLKMTRASHVLPGQHRPTAFLELETIDRPSGASPNGNTVSLEQEMLEAIEADRSHNRAVTIYQTALGILRTSISSGR